MSVEFLAPYSTELQQIYYLSPVAIGFIGWLWRQLKQERSEQNGIPVDALEIDHVVPRYKGGKDTEANLQALTRPEHAVKHQRAAETAKEKRERHFESRAAGMIVSRMTKEEYRDYLKRLRD